VVILIHSVTGAKPEVKSEVDDTQNFLCIISQRKLSKIILVGHVK